MKRIFAYIAILGFCLGAAQQAQAEPLVIPTLSGWQPISVDKTDGIVTITLSQNQITDTIYNAVIRAGVCPSLFVNEKLLDDVREMRVLNKHKFRGFVAEGGKALCDDLNAETSGQGKSFTLLAVTHTF